jgi:nickel-dependent lactate racemase
VKIRLAYGTTGLDVSLPEGPKVDVVRPQHSAAPADQAGAVRNALRHPIGTRPLRELVRPSDTVGIVCNDITRPTPYHTILPVLLEELHPIPDEAIVLLIATGTHRPCTADELRAMLGNEIVKRFRIVQNDAHDRDSHALVGARRGSLQAAGPGDGRTVQALRHPQAALEAATRSMSTRAHYEPAGGKADARAPGSAGATRGNHEIWIHKEYLRCDVRILTGFIEPHFFAGFSGGGKAVMPGLALLETILQNHHARNIDHPNAASCIAAGNPVWEGIHTAALMAAPTFLLNVALNREQQITGVFAGDLEQAHAQGCAFVARHATAAVPAPCDIVITSNCGHPLDRNLYQAVKGMCAGGRIVKEGGTVIVAAECRDGIPEHGQYKRLLWESAGPGELLRKIRAGECPCQDAWQAHIQALVCERAEVYLFSHHLTDEQITRALLRPCRDIAGTVNRLLESLGRDASICILPEGPQTICVIGDAS